MNNKRRLGRGLAALLGTEEGGFEPSSLDSAELMHIPVDQIDPNPFQPRRTFDPAEIAALADSLKQHGMLQPILVRPVHDRYQIIAGERRLRASIEAQLHEVPARVMELDDQRVSELAMVENLQREDLNALEKAAAFRDYLARYGGTQEELASRLGLDRSTVTNLLRLLDLPVQVQDAVRSKKISQGHAAEPCWDWTIRPPSGVLRPRGGRRPLRCGRPRRWSPRASRRPRGPESAKIPPSRRPSPAAAGPRISMTSRIICAAGSAPTSSSACGPKSGDNS